MVSMYCVYFSKVNCRPNQIRLNFGVYYFLDRAMLNNSTHEIDTVVMENYKCFGSSKVAMSDKTMSLSI